MDTLAESIVGTCGFLEIHSTCTDVGIDDHKEYGARHYSTCANIMAMLIGILGSDYLGSISMSY